MDERAERLARGDPSAFVELYDACADRLHHYLVSRLASRADADDVLQEAFVCLARTRNRLARVDNLQAYCVRDGTQCGRSLDPAGRRAKAGCAADLSLELLFEACARR